MISITTSLISELLGSVLSAWISCEPVMVLFGLFVFGYIVGLFLRLLNK